MKKVEWLNARELTADVDMIKVINESYGGTEFLVINTTFGIVKELEDVIMVTTEKCSNGDETITVIPKSWILNIK